ncbi:MAG: GNAT family N-acetyltransferase [Oscillospiraceae bacterium]|nr:GNAT family N-acetyltransferase [Oscillospiraceae bacterium]MBQ3048783.1 GNAT family N-acetyltransferase [Oscillospiraceae bacterium]MBQ9938776.1 GNAT family N-acetyltransferase [Oscillospiraceae bacterium]
MMLDYRQKLLSLLAIEYNCEPKDFLKSENMLTASALNEGRRRYGEEKYFFHMVTLGGNAVITADETLHPFLREFMRERTGHWLFELPNLLSLEKELKRHGHALNQSFHMFLPHTEVSPAKSYAVKWFFGDEIHRFYGDERFSNAISSSYNPLRPDRIAVCAYDGESIMGMAGCSEDTDNWMQIGIDVLPEYRSNGVGSYLVTLLKNKITELGQIPFYGTSLSNYHSWNVALNSGFRPVWVEIGSKKIKNI